MAVFLQTRDLVKSFSGRRILHGVSLDVDQGEMLCILGPSGCGKTTFLRCLAGLETPDAGAILLNGGNITALLTMHAFRRVKPANKLATINLRRILEG